MIINFLDKVICHANLDSFIPFGHAVTHADLYMYLLIWRYIIRQIHNNICVSGLTNICPACRYFIFSLYTHYKVPVHTHRGMINGQLVVHVLRYWHTMNIYRTICTYMYIDWIKVIVYILYTIHFVRLCFIQIIFFKLNV